MSDNDWVYKPKHNLGPYTESDGVTVWVHLSGVTIARFGKRGIDVHNSEATACLECVAMIEGDTGLAEWRRFQDSVAMHYNFSVSDRFMPHRVRKEIEDMVAYRPTSKTTAFPD